MNQIVASIPWLKPVVFWFNIKRSLDSGHSPEQVKNALRRSGWGEHHIEDAFASVHDPVPVPRPAVHHETAHPQKKIGIFRRMAMVLKSPKEFFEQIKHETGLKTPFIYFAVISLIGTIMSFIFVYIFMTYLMTGIGAGQPVLVELQSRISIQQTVISYVSSLVMIFISSALVHAFVILFGSKKKYGTTFNAVVYAGTPLSLLAWIVILPLFIFGIMAFAISGSIIILILALWSLYLAYKGLSIFHGISEWRAFLAYVIPSLILYGAINAINNIAPIMARAVGL